MTSLGRIIKPGVGEESVRLHPHQFSSFDSATPGKDGQLSLEACTRFERGLVPKKNRCPPLSQMGDKLAAQVVSNHRFDADIYEQTAERSDPEEERHAVACIWEKLNQAVERFDEEKNAMVERIAQETVRLALAISEKIMNHQANVDPELMRRLVLHALQKTHRDTVVRIRVHPKDIQVMKKASMDTACLEKEFRGVVFEVDDTLQRGDCLVETPDMNFDVGIQSQLEVIEKAFASVDEIKQSIST
jgi:hypothetical protein